MADDGASDSEGSDISGVDEYISNDLKGEIAGGHVDPLDRTQDGGNDETRPLWIENLFHKSDKSDDEFEGFHHDWVTDPHCFHSVNIPGCSLDGGSAYQHPEDMTAGYYFGLMWDDEMWDRLTTESNRYAAQQRIAHPPPLSAARWTDLTKNGMKAFIGLCFSMGILKLPRRHLYWRTSKWLLKTNFPSVMARNKFEQMWRYLHLQDNTVPAPAGEEVWKLRWFLDHLTTRFQEAYTPHGHATIDESMIKLKGRLSSRQCLPSKPIKWGIKMWALCESASGYAYNMQVYTGKIEGQQEKGLAHRVCMDLLAPMLGTNLHVYMDNLYTSVPLLTDLHVRGILACGTVQANRKGLPATLLPKNIRLKRGEFRQAQKDDLAYSIWMDTKPVVMLSNFHDPAEQGTVMRRREHTRTEVPVPKMVEAYQQHMRGVDMLDQAISKYTLNHRSKKWWRTIFFHGMMVSAHNAYLVAKHQGHAVHRQQWPTFLEFLEDVAADLIGDTRADRAPQLPRLPERPLQSHTLERMFAKRRVCRECSLSSTFRERAQATNYGCRECSVPLHQKCLSAHITRANVG